MRKSMNYKIITKGLENYTQLIDVNYLLLFDRKINGFHGEVLPCLDKK
jgi:hypothetical protein